LDRYIVDTQVMPPNVHDAPQTTERHVDKENFLTEAATSQITTLSRSTINRKVAAGQFPKPIYISDRRKAWKESAVRQWMAELEAA
jgi:predicted DNA-binding transcriptional regulator AlpA